MEKINVRMRSNMQINEQYMGLTARNIPGIQNQLIKGKVAIAGLGGLGSNIAVMLARVGVGNLLLVDFDRVEISNLNRQHYHMEHLGMYKTEALKMQLGMINPYIGVKTRNVKITEENAVEIFKDYPIVCEAFDKADYKAVLVNKILEDGKTKIVAASGMNGFNSANRIQTKQVFGNLYICGDDIPPEQEGIGFMAPRVIVCAGHQANMVIRLLLDEEGV
ncbi:MAG: sulfur carrier protein ThiS adenylyltransferase ThiF [Lachnoclostridium sp.]|jgi:sulfur carrier protein ThiS adenylyltransferase|nr:sulfur carrier protein ThiS adenylyltransferase ThiF [Lachnoclostridium sp.]